MAELKKRRITRKDHEAIAATICEELQERQKSEYRMRHESIWNEVDRIVSMEPPKEERGTGNPEEKWENAIQLGDLADASETITADSMRMLFPIDRKWFEPHVDMEQMVPVKRQRMNDGVLRNLMVQQHKDFGFRKRLKLSIKEALHHGSFVAVVDWETLTKFPSGRSRKKIEAPAWVPHSMWNCYPDPSPIVTGTEMFYQGSMIVVEWWPKEKAKTMPGWINQDKIEAGGEKWRETFYSEIPKEHVQIITLYGDVHVERSDGMVFGPNRTTRLANGILVYTEENKTPYSPILYGGYEREDVRDPYHTSPIVKRAPMAKFAGHMANKAMDAVDMKTKPPIFWDKLDNHLAAQGGPKLYPGAKNPTRGGPNFGTVDTADPQWAMTGFTMAQRDVHKGTTVDSVRAGVSPGTEQTATEVVKTEQRAEVREVEFVAEVSDVLRAFLYMQHELNKQKMGTYAFYNDERNTPDFLRLTKDDLPDAVHFEVTGARSVLGEDQRNQRFMQTAAGAAQIPQIAAETDWAEVTEQMWTDTRQKDPERFIKKTDEDSKVQQAVAAVQQQAQEAIGQLQQQAQEVAKQLQQAEAQNAQIKSENARLKVDVNSLQEQIRIKQELDRAKTELLGIQEAIEQQAESAEEGEREQNTDRLESEMQRLKEQIAANQAAMTEISKTVERGFQEQAQRREGVISLLSRRGGAAAELVKEVSREKD